MPESITNFNPQPTVTELLSQLVPPPRFQQVSLDSYQADPEYPSQAEAKSRVRAFAEEITKKQLALTNPGFSLSKLFSKKASNNTKNSGHWARGLYLDGGFGVGKTHLLTSLFNLVPGPAYYGTFVEYTNLVGVLGYQAAIGHFSNASLLAIDEFELDDVGDTLLMTRLIRELSDQGVFIAATSNTLPKALGEGRFAAVDFLREINAMAERFEVVRIEGEDYRRREAIIESPALSIEWVTESADKAAANSLAVTLDKASEVNAYLEKIHPSKYGKLADQLARVHLQNLETFNGHHQALRFVVLIDRLYDRDIPVVYSGVPVAQLFSAELLASGYSKKYYRCLSRFGALAATGSKLALMGN